MADLMPAYPEFNEITLHHVLTQTTGLSWAESGPLWVDWAFSDDWVAAALARGQEKNPGEEFKYSSGNSHFLISLVYYSAHIKPGTMAKEYLFDPMGIPFDTLAQTIGVVPSRDLVVVLKYEAEDPVHPESGSAHDDMHLFELVVESVIE